MGQASEERFAHSLGACLPGVLSRWSCGCWVISMRGAPVSLPAFATAQFERFFECGRAVRCMLPLGAGRFKQLVVLYG